MNQPLFIQPDVTFEKIAAEVDLSEDPNQWPHEVVQELYKQVPYISDFEPHVVMEKVDSERGYGMGYVELTTKSEAQRDADPAMQEAAGIRSVRVPVVIKEKKLCPFDVLINDASKVLPLTEARLRTALFRPQAFDVTSQTPGDQSMIGQLYPPYRQNYGFGGGGISMGAGMGKNASALEQYLSGGSEKTAGVHEEQLVKDLESKDAGFRRPVFRKTASLMTATFSTFNKADIDEFFDKLASDTSLQAAYRKNSSALSGPVSLLAHNEPLGAEKTAEALASVIRPSVTQLLKVQDGYVMKTASSNYWSPSTVLVTRQDVVRAFGEKVALAADEAGQVTLAEGAEEAPPASPASLDVEQPRLIEASGLYKVVEEGTGKELIGGVVTNLLDVDGTPLPLALFTNGSHSAVQPDIMGVPVGESLNLPTSEPSGSGSFFSQTAGGKLQATIPLELSGASYSMPDQPSTFVGETFDGRSIEVSIQPNITTLVLSPEGKLLVPETWQWTPLGASAVVSLVGGEEEEPAPEGWHDSTEREDPQDLDALGTETKESHVVVRGDHDCFTFEGPAVEKLASTETTMLSLDQAMFLLAGLGVHQGYGVEKLAHSLNSPQRVKVGRQIKTAAEQDAWARNEASKYVHVADSLRKDLSKEAAVIPDPTTVDTVLSLGFINPQNIMSFVSYLPTLEESQSKMCELLLAARLGVSDVPVSALERAVRSMEETIEGLKVLAFQGS
jgi:hypothetical protein